MFPELKEEKGDDPEEEQEIEIPREVIPDQQLPILPPIPCQINALTMSLKVKSVMKKKQTRRAAVAASYDVQMKGKDISYKYFFLPRLTSQFVPE